MHRSPEEKVSRDSKHGKEWTGCCYSWEANPSSKHSQRWGGGGESWSSLSRMWAAGRRTIDIRAALGCIKRWNLDGTQGGVRSKAARPFRKRC